MVKAPNLRAAISGLRRYIVTPRVAKAQISPGSSRKHWSTDNWIAFCALGRFSRRFSHSRIHEIWALRMGTQLETAAYTPDELFETFPLPECVWAAEGCGAGVSPAFQSTGKRLLCNDQEEQKRQAGRLHHKWQARCLPYVMPLPPRHASWTNSATAGSIRRMDQTEVLEFPGSVDGPWRDISDPATCGRRKALP